MGLKDKDPHLAKVRVAGSNPVFRPNEVGQRRVSSFSALGVPAPVRLPAARVNSVDLRKRCRVCSGSFLA